MFYLGEGGLLIHCISGWDRTPLFISLLRMSLWAVRLSSWLNGLVTHTICLENIWIEKGVFRLVTSVGQRKKLWVPMSSFSKFIWLASEDRFLMGTQNFFLVPRSWQDAKTSFSISLPSSTLTISLIIFTNMELSTLLILAVYRTLVIWTL